MSSDGKSLEKTVAALESQLLGSNFTVSPNDKVYDDKGNQIAEFDIVIKGKVGSTIFRWLIECRDRPSHNSEPGSWIEQLATRKQRFRFDKVIAVATAKFSPSAIQAAEQFNIILREVKSVEDISKQFGTIEFRMATTNLVLSEQFDLEVDGRDMLDKAKEIGFMMQNPMIREVGESSFLSLRDFISRDLSSKVKIETPENENELKINFDRKAHMELKVADQVIRIKRFMIPITLKYSFHPSTVLTVKSYNENGELIGEDATITSEMENLTIKTDVLITKTDDGNVVVTQNS